ncbi:MAG: hypothetical protein ABGZ37_14295 [Akkermansiaceae bacterium]
MADPKPTPARRRGRFRSVLGLTLALLPVLAILVVVGVVVTIRLRDQPADPETLAATADTPAANPAAYESVGPPLEARLVEEGAPVVAVDPPPAESPEPEPPVIAIVPEPVATPPEPAPKTKPGPEPKAPPIPPEPENLAGTTPIFKGLIFYAALDEDSSELNAKDMSPGGRHLDIANGLPGDLGRVGLACRLRKEGGLISEATPLPKMTAMTISFWIRRPEPMPDEEPPAKDKPAPTVPPVNLVSFKDYCDLRLDNNQVVADLDRKGAETRLDLPQDHRWHHVLVENGEGTTSIWIDHRSHSKPIMETLAPPPAEAVSVQIGDDGADFYVDEVAIWDRKFTSDERQILYRLGRLDSPILMPTKTIAYWGFDEKRNARLFIDGAGNHALGAYKSWRSVKGISPNPIPLTLQPNSFAAEVWHIAERPENAGSFQMKPDVAFTYEGWVKLGAHSSGTLGGTISGATEDRTPGWLIAARQEKSAKGLLAFIYETGSGKVQALGKELPLYDGRAHHFAAVWNPMGSPTHGTMELYLDNEIVAAASLLLSDLGSDSDLPFRIVAKGAPIVLDELRFSSGALKPEAFLTAGLNASNAIDPPTKEETVMERRNREAMERKTAQAAKRKKMKEEQAAAVAKRKQEEEERRKRK